MIGSSRCSVLAPDLTLATVAGVEALIQATDDCVVYNASSLQCLRCETTCSSACINAVRSSGVTGSVAILSVTKEVT